MPVLDASRLYGDGGERESFDRKFGEALEGIGFVVLENHPVPSELITDVYTVMRQLFAYPDDVLQRYEHPEWGRQRGFTGFQTEHAKDQSPDRADLKRLWMVGREVSAEHPYRGMRGYLDNVWPEGVPDFRDAMVMMFNILENLALALIDSVNRHLKLPEGTLRGFMENGDSVMRPLHYPAMDSPLDATRSSAHEDICWLTLLPAATESGLWVMNRADQKVYVNERPGQIVVNAGDTLQMFSLGLIRSTTHGVDVTPNERFSLPFFFHSQRDVVLITSERYLLRRLVEIGLLQRPEDNPIFFRPLRVEAVEEAVAG